MRDLEEKSFLLLLAAVSLAFAWLLWPFSGAILWGVVFAIVFAPLYRWLFAVTRQRRNIAALAAVILILLIVILPLLALGTLVVREGVGVYSRIASGEVNLGRFFREVFEALPPWASATLDRFGLADFEGVQQRLTAALARGSQLLASTALNIGQNTLDFVVSFFIALYLLFFLLRDGDAVLAHLRDAIPLQPEQRRELFGRFTTVIRATVKGSIVIAVVQGTLGGGIFWLLGIPSAILWGAVMAALSLLPAVGAALVWLPVGVYFLATGAVWQGVVLIAYGVLVISMVDNVLRPVLVGKDTQMPDYLVLLSTLGGIAVLGVNGLVIGPVIAALFLAAWDLFVTQRRRTEDDEPSA
jgi:predicted PurR-regulated permease PerM